MPAIPLAEFGPELLALYRETRAPSTWGKMRQVLREFAALPGVETTADLTPVNVAAFKRACDAGGRHPNTTATLLSYLRRAARYAVDRRYAEASPFAAWEGYVTPVAATPPPHHGSDQIARVLGALRRGAVDWTGRRLHAVAALAALTGMRRDEVLFLLVKNVDLGGRVIRVTGEARRLKRPTAAREAPITEDLAAVLADWLPATGGVWVAPNQRRTGAWSSGLIGYRPTDRLKQAGRAVGVEGFTFASLRHSFATLAATEWGLPPAVLQAIMGHTSITTTLKYYVHVDRSHLAAAARSIRFDAAGPAASGPRAG